MAMPSASSYHQFQQSLDQYIYFSPLTMGGASGRSVKISKDLFLPFFCAVDPNTHDGQGIIRQIENLRTTCTIARQETGSNYANNPRQKQAHKDRLSKLNDSFQQVLIIKNLHVYYRVSQEQGDKAPSIYIMNIRVVNRDTGGESGLYEAGKSFRGSKSVEKLKLLNADGRKIYINGSTQTLKAAIASARYATEDNNSLLFYCPTRVGDELGVFGSSAKSRVTTGAINELVNVFKQNQRAAKGVSWYVEGEAVNLLAQAIKQLPGDLNKHSFRLINPIANTATLLKGLTDKKATLEGEFFKYDQNRAALVSLGAQKDQLMQAIGKLPAGKNYDKITRGYIMKSIAELSSTGNRVSTQQAKLNSVNNTFVQLLKTAGVYRK